DMDWSLRGQHFGPSGGIGEAHGRHGRAVAGRGKPVEDAKLDELGAFLFEIIGRYRRSRSDIEKAALRAVVIADQQLDVACLRNQLVEGMLKLVRRFFLKRR